MIVFIVAAGLLAGLPAAQQVAPTTQIVVNTGFEPGELASAGGEPLRFVTPSAGWNWSASDERVHSGSHSAKFVCDRDSDEALGSLLASMPAESLRGRKLRLDARVWVEGKGRAQMWLRVDCAGGRRGAFDNMWDRPIFGASWHDATIEVEVDRDAERLVFGFLSFDRATLFVDDLRAVVHGAPRALQEPTSAEPLSPRELDNVCAAARALAYVRYFHPSDAVAGMRAWEHFAVELLEAAAPADDDVELAHVLLSGLEPLAPGIQIWPASERERPAPCVPAESSLAAQWRRHGLGPNSDGSRRGVYSSSVLRVPRVDGAPLRQLEFELPGGVWLRMALDLPVVSGRTLPLSQTPARWLALDELPSFNALNRWTRLAAAAHLWGAMQHFYPYFDVVGTDWNAELAPLLARAASDATSAAFDDTLQRTVAKLHDGHGSTGASVDRRAGWLPFTARWLGDELTITSVAPSATRELRPGDVVLAIDGASSNRIHRELSERVSAAGEGWRRHMTAQNLVYEWTTGPQAELSLRGIDGALRTEVVSRMTDGRVPTRTRPANGAELAPGVVYMNLVGADDVALDAVSDALDSAQGIVFDLRGYPSSAARQVVRRLAKGEIRSAKFEIPTITRPDREGWEWDGGGWTLAPIEPRWEAEVAWLTDETAISYAETIMGIVEAHDLGLIVGSPTAGTNGNVNSLELPTGQSIKWTGMRVRKHDGSRHHGVGILPDIACVPTPAGIAAGRDEVLERAVEELRKRLAK